MNKFATFCSIALLGFLIYLSTISVNQISVWAALTEPAFNALRYACIVLLFGLLVTAPPRLILFRLTLGITATSLAIWSGGGIYDGTLPLLDGLAFMIVSIVMAINALEIDTTEEQVISPARKRKLELAKKTKSTAKA